MSDNWNWLYGLSITLSLSFIACSTGGAQRLTYHVDLNAHSTCSGAQSGEPNTVSNDHADAAAGNNSIIRSDKLRSPIGNQCGNSVRGRDERRKEMADCEAGVATLRKAT
jgi:hypothetical protein